jgi:hypothetical protein
MHAQLRTNPSLETTWEGGHTKSFCGRRTYSWAVSIGSYTYHNRGSGVEREGGGDRASKQEERREREKGRG